MRAYYFLRSKPTYIILIVLTILFSYLSLSGISKLPRTQNIIEFIKYYINYPLLYLKDTILVLIAFASACFLGVMTIIHALELEEIPLAFRILIGIVGLSIIWIGFYFFSYFIFLIIAIILIIALIAAIFGIIAMILMGNRGTGIYRRY
ncbi:hypothetical protein [Clostridium paridis]|uniref:Uncharacterized protein n=1 Tax=Clostridium paridis TaxID=2803863 RepID=A0A937K304_9CLOT|nr:hypothetical protein [Clostridium paridis]MBL4931152.1 hypothetical protein [Clostridium paridis]